MPTRTEIYANLLGSLQSPASGAGEGFGDAFEGVCSEVGRGWRSIEADEAFCRARTRNRQCCILGAVQRKLLATSRGDITLTSATQCYRKPPCFTPFNGS